MATKKRSTSRPVAPPIFYDGPPGQGGAPMAAGAAAEARFNYYARMSAEDRRIPRKPPRRRRRAKP